MVLVPCALQAEAQGAPSDFVPVTDSMLQNPDPADWLMWRRTLDGWGYSPLDQVDRENVSELRMVWSKALVQEGGSQQGTPLVYDGILYMPNPQDVIRALNAVTGERIWEYRRKWPEDLTTFLRDPGRKRNQAIYGNLIIASSGDDFVFAVDATSGKLVWETQILDYRINPALQSSGPIIADGRVISGRSCRPWGGPNACVIVAHDASTGTELWRRRLIPAPGEPGDETWGDVPFEGRQHVGAWMVPSYDPELDLFYIGTAQAKPWVAASRGMSTSNDAL